MAHSYLATNWKEGFDMHPLGLPPLVMPQWGGSGPWRAVQGSKGMATELLSILELEEL